MKRFLFLLIVFCAAAWGQELQPADTVAPTAIFWKHTIGGTFGVTQVTFTDWEQGGENNLAYNINLLGKSTYEDADYLWATTYKFSFGQTKLGQQDFRKNDDRIDFESVLTYKLGTWVNPYAAVSVKTQFATGYHYEPSGNRTPVSRFFDPAYLVQSIGSGYQIIPQVRTRIGMALREIVTSEFFTYADDPTTAEIEKVKIEDGLESVTDIQWKIEENVTFTSKVEFFTSFKKPEKVVVRGDNTLTTRIGKVVTVMLNVQLINDHLVSPRTQFKQTFGIGLSYTVM